MQSIWKYAVTGVSAIAASVMLGSAASAYMAYDTNNDSYLNEREYISYSYDVIDTNDDGYLGHDEWAEYTDVWYDPYDNVYYEGDFANYDVDNDGFIEQIEYTDAYDSNLYDSWDMDNNGYVDENEYSELTTQYEDVDENDIYEF